MIGYLIRRLFLIPVTLFAILLVNFVILSLAPGDPTTIATIGTADALHDTSQGREFEREDQYLLFREHYGLTRPILFNRWPYTSKSWVLDRLRILETRRLPGSRRELSSKRFSQIRVNFGDRARYVMPTLLEIAEDREQSVTIRQLALRYLVRGGMRIGKAGAYVTPRQRQENREIAASNRFLRNLGARQSLDSDAEAVINQKVAAFAQWYGKHVEEFRSPKGISHRISQFLLDTRFARYFRRVLTLDFGSLRNDANRSVVSEVAKRLKVSLTLAVLPMIVTFGLCQIFGFLMALHQNRWVDITLNVAFLLLYALPVFVVAPFLIENVALHQRLPLVDLSFPVSGYTSGADIYRDLDSWHRFLDICLHLCLPLIAVMYGTLAVQSRISRTAILEVLRQDYIRTARAKGVRPLALLSKHVGRNAAITIVTSLAASFGVILGGTLIVETIFGIDGFGRFYYLAILNRDYNVILFSTMVGAALTLVGFLVADLAYMWLDPRVTLD